MKFLVTVSRTLVVEAPSAEAIQKANSTDLVNELDGVEVTFEPAEEADGRAEVEIDEDGEVIG